MICFLRSLLIPVQNSDARNVFTALLRSGADIVRIKGHPHCLNRDWSELVFQQPNIKMDQSEFADRRNNPTGGKDFL